VSRLARNTAEGMAALRAAGATEQDPLIRNPDGMAREFIMPRLTVNALVLVPGLQRLVPAVAECVLPGAYFFEIARVKHVDQVLYREIEHGVTQVTILGAGYDTRAYRFGDLLRNIRVFEVDQPPILRLKLDRVRRLFGEIPTHVRYVAADFITDDFEAILATHGYEADRPTLLIICGLLPYLPQVTVDRLMSFAGGHSSPRTTVVFDYAFHEMVAGDNRFHGAAQVRRHLEKLGEPMHFGIPQGAVESFLEAHGLDLIGHLNPDDLAEKYLRLQNGRVAGQTYGFVAIAHARVANAHPSAGAGPWG